jgi:hypothetical protein
MSKRKRPPAHARSDGSADAGDGSDVAADGASATPLATALRDLGPPRHGPDFWTGLDRRLADEPQLRLAPRSAIRPITQPPPVIDDRNLLEGLKGGGIPSPPRRSSRRTVLAVVAAVVIGLLVLAAVQSSDGDPVATEDPAADRTESTQPGEPADDATATTTPTTAAPTTTAPGRVDDDAALTPAGVGPLRIGQTMAELQAAGLTIQPDQAEFTTSGGSCYTARAAGALDLKLRFRAPDEVYGVADPIEGELAAITIEPGLPTARTSNTDIALGAPQERVLSTYGGNLDERQHPFVPGGLILRSDNGDGNGIAYATDGASVIGITVGRYDVVRFVNQCR